MKSVRNQLNFEFNIILYSEFELFMLILTILTNSKPLNSVIVFFAVSLDTENNAFALWENKEIDKT